MVACPSCPIAPLGRGVTRGTCGSGTSGRGAVHPCPTNWSKAVYSCLGGVDFDPDKQTLRGESRDKKLLTDAEDGVRMPAVGVPDTEQSASNPRTRKRKHPSLAPIDSFLCHEVVSRALARCRGSAQRKHLWKAKTPPPPSQMAHSFIK